MELPNDIPTVMRNAATYFMTSGNDIPEFQRERILAVMGPGISPVDFVVRVAEALYAVADELDNQGREVAAQNANLASLNGWHGMAERGSQMVNALKRMNGETTSQPEEDDPEPLATELVPPAEDTPAPAEEPALVIPEDAGQPLPVQDEEENPPGKSRK